MNKKSILSIVLLPFILTGCDVTTLAKPDKHTPEKPVFEEYSNKIENQKTYYSDLFKTIDNYIFDMYTIARQGEMTDYSYLEVEYTQNDNWFYSLFEHLATYDVKYDSTHDRYRNNNKFEDYGYTFDSDRILDNNSKEIDPLYAIYDAEKGQELNAYPEIRAYSYFDRGRTSVSYLASSSFETLLKYVNGQSLDTIFSDYLKQNESLVPGFYKDKDAKLFTITLEDEHAVEKYDAGRLLYKRNYKVDFIVQMDFEEGIYNYKFYYLVENTYEFFEEQEFEYYDGGELTTTNHTFYPGEKITVNELQITDSKVKVEDVVIPEVDISNFREI